MEKKEILPNLGKDVENQLKIDFRVNSSQNDYNEDQEKNQIQKEQLNQLRRSMGSLQEKEEKEEFKSDNMVFQLVDKKQGNLGNGKQFGKSVNFQRNQEEYENQNEQFEIEEKEEEENQNYQKNQSYFEGHNQNQSQYYGQELEENREEFDYDVNEQNRVQINNLMNDDIQLSLVYQDNYNKEQFLNNQGDRQNKNGSPYQIDYQTSNMRFGEASSNNLNNYNKKLGLSGMNKKTTDVNSIYNYSTASNFYRVGSRVGTTQQGSRKNRTLVKGQWSSNKIDNNFLEQSAIQFDQNSNLNINNSNLNGNGRYRRAISQSNQKRILNKRVGNSSQMNLDNSFYVQDNSVNNNNIKGNIQSFQQKSLNQQSQIKNPYYQAKNIQSSVVTPTQQKKGQSFSSIKALSKFQKNINSGMMEKWINDTIMESELYVPDKKEKFEAPLKNYKLDLISLSGKDVNKESIQRMYRCLFVYSLGFYEMLNQIFDHANDKNMLIASVWKIFGILLESCSKEEYKMVVIELEKQKLHLKQEMEKEVQKQKDIIAKIESRENEIKDRLELQIKQLQMEKQNLLIEQRKIQSDFVQADNAYNQEVTIRLKFEHKINEVNSIHRELLIKHERLLKDFKQLQKQVDKHNQEIMERTNNQIKQQSQISQLKQSDRQNGQTIELYKISELKQKEKFEEYEKNIERLFKEKSQFQKTIQDMENHMAILKMENNKNLSQISIQQNQNEEMGNLIKLLKDEKEEQKKISEKQFNEIKKAQIEIQSLKNYKEEIIQKHDLLDKQLLKSQKIAADYKREIEEQGKKQRDNLVQIESQEMEIENQKKRIENLERAVKFIKESKLQADLMVEDVREKMSIVKEEYLALQQKQQTQIKLMRCLEEDLAEKKQKIVELQNIIDEEQEKNEKLEIEKVDLVGQQQEKLGKIEINYEDAKKEVEKMTIRQGELYKELLDKKQQVILLEDEKEQLQLDLQNKNDYLEQKIEESKQLHAKLIETQQNLQVQREK
ncbi:hypothetical protein PPERSA_10964 [Pseudocohnilembus persalinus]|uniref:Uncharacterized protein n=1 Tax=Pseudocohnilembus persalinus TaxID=266149 RepID=A0A0V0QC87_PSEPJ|nr:hypothetical protein PPERSA_10964 [Pseudocohnilembus persalinus]|eukprot:KRW99845.1 hypothetical protein PPERSA_10964 [Pseudocohnilembus persalinus]